MNLASLSRLSVCALWACCFLTSCSDEGVPLEGPATATTGSLRLTVTLVASDDRGNVFPLGLGSTEHQAASGERFTLTGCRFILSHVGLDPCDGHPSDFQDVHRVEMSSPSTAQFQIDGIARGHYCDLVFTFGLPAADNTTGALPSEFSPLAWPPDLGGGYHYLQMEGEILDPVTKETTPFVVALGRLHDQSNEFLVTLTPHLNISRQRVTTVEVILDVNQWFRTPHTLDLQAFTAETRDDGQLLRELKENGADAFGLGVIRTGE